MNLGVAEKNRGGKNRVRMAKIFFSGPLFFFLPSPAEFDSAPGAEQTRGGAENLIIPRERGRNV